MNGFYKEFVGWIFAQEYDKQIVLGIGLLIAGLWTYLTSEDYILVKGKKEKIHLGNHLYFISLKNWAYIIFVVGILVLISGIIKTIN